MLKDLEPASRLSDYSRLERTVFARPNVRALRSIVVGAGALGNEVAKALGLLGVGFVAIVDSDRVSSSDLTRSVFFRESDFVDQNKAYSLVTAAGHLFHDTSFTAFQTEIADVGYGDLEGDIVFSCVDNDLARLEIACISTTLGIPVCDAGLGTPNYSHGRVSWFSGKSGACFGCKLSANKRRELLTFWDATMRPCADFEPLERAPSTPTMAAITGSLQVELGLRWLMTARDEAVTFDISLDGELRTSTFRTPQSASCPFHEGIREPRYSLPYENATFDALFQSLSGLTRGSPCLMLDWPIVVRVRCLACASEWAPMRRAAAVRRNCVCPSCGSRSILEQESIRVVEPDSRWSRLAPSALGLPANHRYLVRFRKDGE
jgi:hypothetical protein